MKFAIACNFSKPHIKEVASEVVRFLEDKGHKAVFANEQDLSGSDFLISLGGDGSILSVIHRFPSLSAPIIGVNFGTLGFLADIVPENLFKSLESILNGNYSVQERLMLHCQKNASENFFALNEIVVHRGTNHSLVDLAVHVDGRHLNSFSADGVIVATPSGSTAYSLSAGGPIVSPELKAIVITPICPHALSNRPIVLGEPNSITVQYTSDYDPVEVALDGMRRFALNPGELCTITPATRPFRLVSVPDYDYFATLRTKLNWTGSLRN
jgi:NAD+ kinase